MACNTSTESSTAREIAPILSIDQESAIAPVRGTRPKEGRRPLTPQRVLGDEIEPRVSVPIAKPTQPAATALADPAELPLEPWWVFHGLRVRAPNQRSPCASPPSESFA